MMTRMARKMVVMVMCKFAEKSTKQKLAFFLVMFDYAKLPVNFVQSQKWVFVCTVDCIDNTYKK